MEYLAVGLGGFMGAVIRAFLSQLHMSSNYIFPFNTLLINITGSFILSLFLFLIVEQWSISPILKLGISTGFLGAYTTFSTFALETVLLIKKGFIVYALIYSFSSLTGGILFSWTGLLIARYIGKKPDKLSN